MSTGNPHKKSYPETFLLLFTLSRKIRKKFPSNIVLLVCLKELNVLSEKTSSKLLNL